MRSHALNLSSSASISSARRSFLDLVASALRGFSESFLDGKFGCFSHGKPHIQTTRVRTTPTRSKPGTSYQQDWLDDLGRSPPRAEAYGFKSTASDPAQASVDLDQYELSSRGTVLRPMSARLGFYSCSAAFLAIISCASHSAIAQSLTPFRYESQAQRHCPGDMIVWLDFRTGRYYLKGQRRYASGYTGSFVCRNEARNSGYRRSPLGLR